MQQGIAAMSAWAAAMPTRQDPSARPREVFIPRNQTLQKCPPGPLDIGGLAIRVTFRSGDITEIVYGTGDLTGFELKRKFLLWGKYEGHLDLTMTGEGWSATYEGNVIGRISCKSGAGTLTWMGKF